jgi:hypothetical protein
MQTAASARTQAPVQDSYPARTPTRDSYGAIAARQAAAPAARGNEACTGGEQKKLPPGPGSSRKSTEVLRGKHRKVPASERPKGSRNRGVGLDNPANQMALEQMASTQAREPAGRGTDEQNRRVLKRLSTNPVRGTESTRDPCGDRSTGVLWNSARIPSPVESLQETHVEAEAREIVGIRLRPDGIELRKGMGQGYPLPKILRKSSWMADTIDDGNGNPKYYMYDG